MVLPSLAWRNALRNPRRTVLTLAVVALGVAALVFTWALFDGANDQSVRAMTGTFTGHLQVRRAGYGADPNLDLNFDAGGLSLQQLTALPGVQAAAARLQAPAMVSTDGGSRGILLVGVDPLREPQVTALHGKLTSGRWLGETPGGMVLGRSLAQALKVRVGERVDVLTQGLQGSIGAARYTVLGVYDSGSEMVDGLQAFISLADAQALLSAGGRATGVTLRLDHYESGAATAARIRTLLPEGFEVEPWAGLLPDLAQKVAFHEWIAGIVMAILFGIVMVGVANTLLMSTLERTREFGVLLALGTRPWQLFLLIMAEGAVIGLAGFVLGLAVGGAAVLHFGASGLDFSAQSSAVQQMPGITRHIYPHLSAGRMLFIGGAVLALTLIAALLPAWRTAQLIPLRALRAGAQSPYRGRARAPSSGRFLLAWLALRNLGRQPLRTMLSGFGLMFATATFVFLGCFIDGYGRQIVENAIGFIAGDGQVQQRDYRTQLDPALALDDTAALLDTVAAVPNVRAAAPRVQVPGLVASAQGAEPVLLMGVQPAREQQVTFLYKAVHEGRYLDAANDHEVVLGRTLARRLRVVVGDKVVVTAPDAKGALVSEAFVVVGLFDTGSHGFDETLAQLSMPALQRMLGLGGRATSVVFRLHDAQQSSQTLAAVRGVVRQPDARIYAWHELLPEVAQMNSLLAGSLLLVMALVMATVAVVLMNSVLMSVLERTREFGVALAIGTAPRRIVQVVVLEAAVLGGAGSLAGLGLGSLAAWAHSQTGMSMRSHGLSAIPGTTDVVHPQLSMATTLQPALLMALTVVVVSLLPAWRASRLQPAVALRAV